MILLLDNYDSFTYNIEQYLSQLSVEVVVYKNDAVTINNIANLQPQAIVLGPGPGRPEDAGIMLSVINHFADKIPILGVCLGHQAIVQAFGGKVVRAQQVMHGRTSEVYHQQTGVFIDIDIPTIVTRYHSLLVDKHSLPDTLEINAWTQKLADDTANNLMIADDVEKPQKVSNDATANLDPTAKLDATANLDDIFEIMALRHKTLPIEGVQFHPESILSNSGLQIFKNFLLNHQLIKA